MSDADRPLALGLLDVLVGEWTQQVTGQGDPTGTITFEWALGDACLLQRSTLPPPVRLEPTRPTRPSRHTP